MRTLILLLFCLSVLSSCNHLRKKIPITKEVVTYKSATVYAGSTHYFFTDENGKEIDLSVSNMPDMEDGLNVIVPPILLESTEGLEGPPAENPNAVGETFELIRNAAGEVVEIKAVSGSNYAPTYFIGTWFKKDGNNYDALYFKNDSLMVALNTGHQSKWALKDDQIHYEELPNPAGAKPTKGIYSVKELNYGKLHLVSENGVSSIYSPFEYRVSSDWMTGRWDGPDGSIMDILPEGQDAYLIRENTFDGLLEFKGTSEENLIKYTGTDGNLIYLGPGTGAETGIKAFAGRQECFVRLIGGKFRDGGFCK